MISLENSRLFLDALMEINSMKFLCHHDMNAIQTRGWVAPQSSWAQGGQGGVCTTIPKNLRRPRRFLKKNSIRLLCFSLVVVVGEATDDATQASLRVVRRRLLPGMVLALVDPGEPVDTQVWPTLAGHTMKNGKPTAYLCRNFSCTPPVTNPAEMATFLD